MESILRAKRNAAKKALEYLLEAETIGIGTGSTVNELIGLMRDNRDKFKDKIYIASSYDTMIKLMNLGFKVLHPIAITNIDIYIDSADEVDNNLNMIKGGGAALTLEKILAYYANKRIFIIDYTKKVDWLGKKHPIPIDVIPYAASMIINKLESLGFKAEIRSIIKGKYGPVISDIGGIIIDIKINKPIDIRKFNFELKSIPGVIETGLFIDLADTVIIGYEDGVGKLEASH